MTDFYVLWGDDVQPYVLQLAAEHIEALRLYCNDAARVILERRANEQNLIVLTRRVSRDMMNAQAFHSFEMFGFDFKLTESGKKHSRQRKKEFVLGFATTPDFEPEDMPPRLRRVDGKAVSARPRARRRPQAAAPARARGARSRRGKRRLKSVSDRLAALRTLVQAKVAALGSSLWAKLYKMNRLYQRLFTLAASMWRRRPCLDFRFAEAIFLRSFPEFETPAPVRARLEPRLIGESRRILLFTFVAPEPLVDWNAYPFGRLAEEGEPIPI
jgi:hypothetical protein